MLDKKLNRENNNSLGMEDYIFSFLYNEGMSY